MKVENFFWILASLKFENPSSGTFSFSAGLYPVSSHCLGNSQKSFASGHTICQQAFQVVSFSMIVDCCILVFNIESVILCDL